MVQANAVRTEPQQAADGLRHDWQLSEIEALFAKPFMDLLFEAQQVHRRSFDANKIQVSRLISIKTGSCPENCSYCPQSAHFDTGLEKEALMEVAKVVEEAKKAKEGGASRFCMGAAWRNPNGKDFPTVLAMVEGVKALGMETCATLGMLTAEQARQLKDAGLDYYNHNVDTSPEHYENVITTRTHQDRLDTLDLVRDAGLKVCCGGIVGLDEQKRDRARMIQTLATMPAHPDSVPINLLIKIPGTPLENAAEVDPFDFVRTIAVARITMPKSLVRLSAGRTEMSDEMQALCFLAGANSVFCGEKLLTAPNQAPGEDQSLFGRLNLSPM